MRDIIVLELKEQADKTSIENKYPLPPSLDDLDKILEEENDQDITDTKEKISVQVVEDKRNDPSITDLVSHAISKSVKVESFQQPDPLLVDTDIGAIQKKIKFLEQWLGKISAHGPGGGAGSVVKLDHETKLISSSSYNITSKDFYV
ncbi:MAG: hypothetical protein EBU90_19535, partial [Proteobacteria bacterium]|nr:hypothetical protein [Pseudomonadota bacterium]